MQRNQNMNTDGNGKRTRLQIVPWFDREEWLKTYIQIYHSKPELQEKAYTQMCIWKVRQPNLPMGVECTMSVLHVTLCDGQTDTYKNRDLQLLYSTAVMRFLNQLTVISNCKESMYKMAIQQQIPDWMINLRHQAAHGNNMPALYLLRQASLIILQWLQDNYWNPELEIMTNVVIEPDRNIDRRQTNIRELLELWLVLKINYWACLKTIDKIPDKEGRKLAMALATEGGLGIKRTAEMETDTCRKKMKKKVKSGEEYCDDALAGSVQEEVQFTHKIKTAFDPLLRRLFDPLKVKMYRRHDHQENLVKAIVQYEGFCPQIDLDQVSEQDCVQLMGLQGELWREVVQTLQSHRLLPQLLAALMSSRSSAHLWLRLLTQSLTTTPSPHPPPSQSACNLLAEKLPCNVEAEVLFRKAKLLHTKNQMCLELRSPTAKEMDQLQELAQRVLHNPTRFTANYLPSLLNLWPTPLTADAREKLCALAGIYTGSKVTDHKRPAQVFTSASLLDHGVIINEPPPPSAPLDISPWQRFSGGEDWSSCALGALPWQC